MPRKVREISNFGEYNVVAWGIDRQDIFSEETAVVVERFKNI